MKRGTDDVHQSALESEQQREESGAEGKAFTLLPESDAPISAALEHSDRLQQRSSLLAAAAGPNVHAHAVEPHTQPATSSCTASSLTGMRKEACLHYFTSFGSSLWKRVAPTEIKDVAPSANLQLKKSR